MSCQHEHERRTKTAQSNHRVGDCPRRVIPYKESAVCKAAEKKTLTVTKSTSRSDEEENWDDEPLCPPRSLPLGARSILPPNEEEWRLMADQDPHPDSVARDSGHGTMTAEAETVADDEELIRAAGGIDENLSTQHCSDVEWNDEDVLIEINDENVTVHQTPVAASTPVHVSNESEMLSPPESPGGKKPCIQELSMRPKI